MTKLFSFRTLITIVLIAVVIALGLWVLPVSIPLILAFFTALLLEPAVKLFQRQVKLQRNLAVLISFVLFLFIVGISGYFLTTKVVYEVGQLTENAPRYVTEINKMWSNWEANLTAEETGLPEEVVDAITIEMDSFFATIGQNIKDIDYFTPITKFVTSIPNYLVSILVYLIALFLFLMDMPRLKEKFYGHLKDETTEKVNFLTSRMSHVILGFLKAQFLVSIIIFAVSLIGLFFISPEVAIVMSLLIWIIDFIPIIGSIVILGPWSIYHFIVGDIVLGTKLAILAIVLLTIRRTVEPKVMGQQIGLSPLATLISMYLGLQLLGFIGFFVGPLLLILFNSAKEAGIIKLNFKI